jgi:amidase
VSVPDVTQTIIDWAPDALEAAFARRGTYPTRKDEYDPLLASVVDAGHALSAFDHQAIRLR